MRGDVYESSVGLLCVQVSTEDTDALGLVCIVPLSTAAQPAAWRPTVQVDGQPMRALPEQVNTVAVDLVGPRIGTLSADDLAEVGASLKVVLDL